jgi:DNA-binding beta-propeller fold protein YncE
VEVLGDGAVRVVVAGGLNTPMGLAVFDGALWVGEPMAVRGYALADGAPRGVLRHTIGRGPFPGTPMNVAAAGDRLLMTDPFGGAAAFYTPDTGDIVPLTPFGAPVDAEPFVDGFAVSDFATGTVWLARGEALDDRVPVAEGLAPTGLAADGGDLYVGDAATGQVWRVAHHGVPLETPEPLPWSGTTPEGMVVVEGVLYVLDGGTGEVSGLHLDTGRSWSVAIGLGVGPAVDGFPPFKFFNDLVADEAGRLYASGDAAGVVYRL